MARGRRRKPIGGVKPKGRRRVKKVSVKRPRKPLFPTKKAKSRKVRSW